jgi:hypothetical protein
MVAPMREPSEIAFLVCNSKLENMPREANGYMAKEIGRKYGQIVKVK